MTDDYEAELRSIARTLSDIAHTLESSDAPLERVRRVLSLTSGLLPYARCALYDRSSFDEPTLIVVPEPSRKERERLRETLDRILRVIETGEEIGRSSDPLPHLTLPLMGLDEIIGLVRAEPADVAYDAKDLRLLSVVNAQLGAYLTLLRLRREAGRRADELAAAHDFQQLLMGIVSHDLRNPLSVITMAATSLLEQTDDPRKATIVSRALRSAARASRILNDLLDVTQSRVSGQIPISRQRCDVRELISNAVEDSKSANPGREILFEAAPAAILGAWDPDRLTQLTTNLINNALQYGAPGSPVGLALSVSSERVTLSVHNEGPAIPSELVPDLFDPFRRGAVARRGGGTGLGLGLYIVDQIARSHGGAVHVQSSDRDGTTFTVTLPRWAEPLNERDRAEGSLERGRILVVDDDADIRFGMSALLERRGYDVVTASNGAEALELLRGGLRPNLVLLDLWMPVMDGEAFWERCHQDPQLAQIPVLVISADAAAAVKLTQRGASGHLLKPVRAETLFDAVTRLAR